MNNYDYPMGADTKDAPWNETENPEEEIEVTISITLSKTVKIKVTDYTKEVEWNEEENAKREVLNFDDCNFKEAVEEQLWTPEDLERILTYLPDNKSYAVHKIKEDLSGWNVDEIEVVR